jgi:hypothetical protein
MIEFPKSLSGTPRLPRALLLCGESLSPGEANLAKVLDFFGIHWKALTAGEITGALPANPDGSEYCILSSASCMAAAIRSIVGSYGPLPRWMMEASSVYIYGFQDTAPCKELLRILTSDPQANIRNLNTSQAVMFIASNVPEMCGPMSGMGVQVELTQGDLVFDVANRGEGFQSIIRANGGEVLFGVTCRGVRFYLNGCCKTIDITSYSPKYFDVRKDFSGAVPIVMYLKWAFSNIWWTAAETSACLIVDDPPLKPRYGFLHFREALRLMDQHNFTTTIAFIPWNWRRTNPGTVDIFQKRPDRLSLCVHGSDHSGSEFAARSTAQLNSKIKAAGQRMEFLLRRTSLRHARVMIFPQGAFSPETGRALKLNAFVAAVNTEVAPSSNARNETTIADLWNIAIMKYGTFPIFTRRYLTQGVENFAFDGLLGKPCLVVAHHDVFRDHGRDLVDFIAKLNSLKWNLRWRPLGDAISHSFTVRNQPNGPDVVRMFAENLVMENPSKEPRESVFMKEEGDPDCVRAVTVNETAVDFDYDGRYLRWRVMLSPKEVALARVLYFDKLGLGPSNEGIGYSIRVMVRRHLSELRDNYLSQSDFIYERAARIKQVFNRLTWQNSPR